MPTSQTGPLAGLKVLEFAGLGPGPFAATMLADLGATVIRVERPGGTTSLMVADRDPLRRGRSAVILDLRTPAGVDRALELVESADVLIEGNRPGVMERLGIGPDECLARNPRLVYGRMTGWGQTGPLAPRAGHDIGYLAITGALHTIGRAGEAPAIPTNMLGDFAGGSMFLVAGILAAIFESSRSGLGQVVDAAIVDGALAFTLTLHGLMAIDEWVDERGVNLIDSGRPWYDVYEVSDGKHLAVGAIEPKFYEEFMTHLGLEADHAERADPARWPALRERIAAKLATRTRDEWASIFEGTDACVAPVLSLAEAENHAHLAARKSFATIGGITQPVPAPRFSRTQPDVPTAAPALDADPREALRDWGIGDVEAFLA